MAFNLGGLWGSNDPVNKVVLPPFFTATARDEDSPPPPTEENEESTASNSTLAESWEQLPDESDDPRWDQYGFRRDAARLARENAFERAYAARLEQQEMRWGRARDDQIASSRKELKRMVRQGIPAARRQAVWPQLCRAAEIRATCPVGYFDALLAQRAPDKLGEAGFAAERQIELDLGRTFPGHQWLSSPDGAAKLRSVLVAYARRAPAVGYVQGMGFVAALLLVFIEDTEEAFWCLCGVVEWLLPSDYYSPTLLGLRVEQSVFAELVVWKLPRLASHLAHHACVAELFATRVRPLPNPPPRPRHALADPPPLPPRLFRSGLSPSLPTRCP